MTRPALALVTGARRLADHAPARTWLRERLDALGPSVVVTGDADGPDSWARDWCRERSGAVEAWIYMLSGHTRDAFGGRIGTWTGEPVPHDAAERRRWPLFRNERMVSEIARMVGSYDVHVLGLTCPQATTRGTEQTLGLARRAGLAVEARAFELGEGRG